MGDVSMITATTWIPRGFAAEFPTKYEFTEEEYGRLADLAKLQLDDAKDDLESHEANGMSLDAEQEGQKNGHSNGVSTTKTVDEIDDDLKEYDLEHYDDSPDEDDEEEGSKGGPGIFANIKSLVYHNEGEDDPYITLKGGGDDEDDEREDMQILPSDDLVVVARVEDEIAHLEVYVYEDEADNLYVHHDIMLPAIPLCLEWLDLSLGKTQVDADNRGSSVAVGTMDPDIEIWDLDVVDCMYPNAILGKGNEDAEGRKKAIKRKKRSKKANNEYHVDAVLSLAANRQHRNLLASASADQTVKLWDLNTSKCANSYNHHGDKVCAIAWHPRESTALLSGSYDKTVAAADMRSTEAVQRKWMVESDVEDVKWNPHDPNYFYVSTESGILYYFDARVTQSQAVWRLQAHDDSLSAFDINPNIPGFIVTGSADRQTKLWNVQSSGGPSMVVSRDVGVGRVFSTAFAPDAEVSFRLAVAGSQGDLQIWDTSTNAAIRRAFANRGAPMSEAAAEKFITIAADSSESSDAGDAGDDEQEAG